MNEEEVLKFWQANKIFEKSLAKPAPQGEFVFYEGPPTANGRPGIHHLAARAFKDLIPRYKTMRGYHVRRRAGWDTHGLPVELAVEKQLGLKSKKEIEAYGVAAFNEECKKSVWHYLEEWQRFTERLGFWVDQKNAYVTYRNSYIESVWQIMSRVAARGLLYQDYKVVPWCPRCGTALSSHELAQGYQEVEDEAVFIKFKIQNSKVKSEGQNEYLLAWTTTPWTLPGNVALAVAPEVEYVKVKHGDELIWVSAKAQVLFDKDEVVERVKGKDLVGLEYEPLFNFSPQNSQSHRVYAAEFVSAAEGTGIVHTAVMYGADDFALGTAVGLPKQHLVDETGRFNESAGGPARLDDASRSGGLGGLSVISPETNQKIVEGLGNKIFKREKYTHSYPFCWRCKTRLIYYARDSWYIAMSRLREALLATNATINWQPEHLQEGRFGEWLREVKDWAISRERYWGTPLPVWKSKGKGQKAKEEFVVIGSIKELRERTQSRGNSFVILRHGEAEHNVQNICSAKDDPASRLTEVGREEMRVAAQAFSGKKVTRVYSSPLVRARESAAVLAAALGLPAEAVVIDERLREYNFGEFHNKSYAEFAAYEREHLLTYEAAPPGGESYQQAKNRFGEFLYEADKNHAGEVIVVLTHGIAAEVLSAVVEGAASARSKQLAEEVALPTGGALEFEFTPLPHNENFELDLHRPFIDEIKLVGEAGETLERASEVMDVWFDSGAMPWAQDRENLLYPADYICEAIDQTRGWFYTLLAIATLLEAGAPYKNAISLGHLLDSRGKKMSKSVGNVVDPWLMMEKYGADVLRFWFYSVSQPGESKNFDEQTVLEVSRKVFNPLLNVLSFYQLYAGQGAVASQPSGRHALDRWLLARLAQTTSVVTSNLESYQITEAARALRDLVGDLSQWYLRRSRERIKAGGSAGEAALATLGFALAEIAKLLAPFAPFTAERLWQALGRGREAESVHLAEWPRAEKFDEEDLILMSRAREVVTLALEARQAAGFKVRQPLASLKIKTSLPAELAAIVAEEVNVKEVVEDTALEQAVSLDTTLTPELVVAGELREILRELQERRKQAGLAPGAPAKLTLGANLPGREFWTEQAAAILPAVAVTAVKWEAEPPAAEAWHLGHKLFKFNLEAA